MLSTLLDSSISNCILVMLRLYVVLCFVALIQSKWVLSHFQKSDHFGAFGCFHVHEQFHLQFFFSFGNQYPYSLFPWGVLRWAPLHTPSVNISPYPHFRPLLKPKTMIQAVYIVKSATWNISTKNKIKILIDEFTKKCTLLDKMDCSCLIFTCRSCYRTKYNLFTRWAMEE